MCGWLTLRPRVARGRAPTGIRGAGLGHRRGSQETTFASCRRPITRAGWTKIQTPRGEEERMNHDRNDKRKSHKPHRPDEPREQSAHGADVASRHGAQSERNTGTIEPRD